MDNTCTSPLCAQQQQQVQLLPVGHRDLSGRPVRPLSGRPPSLPVIRCVHHTPRSVAPGNACRSLQEATRQSLSLRFHCVTTSYEGEQSSVPLGQTDGCTSSSNSCEGEPQGIEFEHPPERLAYYLVQFAENAPSGELEEHQRPK